MDWALAIVALCLVIIIHEAGHYWAAIATGMRVDRFSIFGIGPAILKLGTWRGTEFVISAIPFGAYVMIQGMEPEDDEAPPGPPDPNSRNFRDKPLAARFLVLFGGPLANYVAAMAILFGVYTTAGAETIEIGEFGEVSAAKDAGLLEGDQFVTIGDTPIDGAAGASAVITASKDYMGRDVLVTVRRGEQLVDATVTFPAEPPALGVVLAVRSSGRAVSVGQAATLAVNKPLAITAAQLVGLYQLITGQLEASMTGPVGIVRHIKRSAEAGIVPFMLTAALISTLLGMFNLLPMPALDGGRIVFLGIEGVRRRPVSGRVEGMVHGYGMLALLLLIAIVTVGDLRGG